MTTDAVPSPRLLTGMRGFTLVWLGQLVSLLGTGMSRFALTIWVWQQTGEATSLALLGFFAFAPGVIVSPIVGALVDRWDKKHAMMISDVAAGLSSTAIFLLLLAGNLQFWHLLLASAFASIFESFQFPAYSAAVTMMVNKDQYTRASALLDMAGSVSGIFSPALAGLLLVAIGIEGVLLLDIITFIFAVAMLFFIFVPNPPPTDIGEKARSSLRQEALFGFRYIFRRPSLLGMQMVFFFINFTATFSVILLPALILSRTNNNEFIFGLVQSAFSVGALAGGIALATWGGPKRRVHGVLIGMIAASLFQQLAFGLTTSAFLWMALAFLGAACIPLINGSNQAIWMAKVPPDVQGKVFSVRRLIAQITAPLAMLCSGILTDNIFEPAMQEGGALATTFGGLVGTGPGAGIALMFVLSGAAGILVALVAYGVSAIRHIETIMPDHDTTKAKPVL